ncbi:MAG: stage III sporulation protein AE, partial [Firmicutes bacterium]|nr:stage III sporulation protein AE [Bacillota bacterium]
MKGQNLQKRKKAVVWFLFLFFVFPISVKAAEQEEVLLEDLELQQMQEAVNELLGEETFSLEKALGEILSGEKSFSKGQIVRFLKEFLLSQFVWDRETYVQIILLVIVAALFSNFTEVFGNGQTGEISFYLVYMLLAAILIHSFGTASQEVSQKLQELLLFMKALMPSYFLAVTAASGSATAMVFYEMVMGAVYLVQVILLKAVIPGIHAYV